MNAIKYSLTIFVVSLILFSCVPQRRYLDVKQKKIDCEQANEQYKEQLRKDTITITEMTARIERMNKEIMSLKKDTALLGNSLRKLTKQYDKINELNDELLRKQKMRSRQDAAEIRQLLADLQKAKEDLQIKEDALKDLEKRLNLKKRNLDELTTQLNEKDSVLNARNRKLIELQNILNKKDSVTKALRDKVNDALLGFKKDGLDVEMKNGKVYVSLQEKLLFKSGRWNIDPKGQKALKDLAQVALKICARGMPIKACGLTWPIHLRKFLYPIPGSMRMTGAPILNSAKVRQIKSAEGRTMSITLSPDRTPLLARMCAKESDLESSSEKVRLVELAASTSPV